jgi:CubicO group peptidase (beta-lactamase class C family)
MKNTGIATLLALLIIPTFGIAQTEVAEAVGAGIDKIVKLHFAAGDFSASILVARDGKILYEQSFGLENREWNIPNDLQTKFEIGSMTKQFTAFLVLQFVNKAKINQSQGEVRSPDRDHRRAGA